MRPFSLTMPIGPAASVDDDALKGITDLIVSGQRELRRRVRKFIKRLEQNTGGGRYPRFARQNNRSSFASRAIGLANTVFKSAIVALRASIALPLFALILKKKFWHKLKQALDVHGVTVSAEMAAQIKTLITEGVEAV